MSGSNEKREDLHFQDRYSTTPVLVSMFFFLFLVTGCNESKKDPPIVLAKIDNRSITLEQYIKRMLAANGTLKWIASLPKDKFATFKKRLLFTMIEEELILYRAGQLNIFPTSAELERETIAFSQEAVVADKEDKKTRVKIRRNILRKLTIENTLQREVYDSIAVTDKEILEYYKKHREEFATSDQIHLLQIMVKDEVDALKIFSKLQNGEDFRKLAIAFSVSPENKSGGDLGFVERSNLPQEFSDSIFALEENEISQIIKSTYGYHIFLPEKIIRGQELPIEQVREKIVSLIRQEKSNEVYKTWIKELFTTTKIDINEQALAAI